MNDEEKKKKEHMDNIAQDVANKMLAEGLSPAEMMFIGVYLFTNVYVASAIKTVPMEFEKEMEDLVMALKKDLVLLHKYKFHMKKEAEANEENDDKIRND